MRSAALPVTLPSSRAPTLYGRAVARTAARFAGVTETMQRAPRSEKRAYSAGEFSFKDMDAPRLFAAKQDSARVTARPPSEISWADWTARASARATRQSMRRFSAARSTAGGSPATRAPTVLEYSEEENSRRASRLDAAVAPSSSKMTSPALWKAIFRAFEESSRMPRMPMTGVG